MDENRLPKIGALLESKNKAIRKEAIDTLSHFSFMNNKLHELLRHYLHSTNWDSRVAASEVLNGILSNVAKQFECETADFNWDVPRVYSEILKLDLKNLSNHYQVLLRFGFVCYGYTTGYNYEKNYRKSANESNRNSLFI